MATNVNLVKKIGTETGKERTKRYMSKTLTDSEEFGFHNNEKGEVEYLKSLGDSATYNNPFTDDYLEEDILFDIIQQFQNNNDLIYSPKKVKDHLISQGHKVKKSTEKAIEERDGFENTFILYPLYSDSLLMTSNDLKERKEGYKNFINYSKAVVEIMRDPDLLFEATKSGQNNELYKGPFSVLEWNTHIQDNQLAHKHITYNSRAFNKKDNTLGLESGDKKITFFDALSKYINEKLIENNLTHRLNDTQIETLKTPGFAFKISTESSANPASTGLGTSIVNNIKSSLSPTQPVSTPTTQPESTQPESTQPESTQPESTSPTQPAVFTQQVKSLNNTLNEKNEYIKQILENNETEDEKEKLNSSLLETYSIKNTDALKEGDNFSRELYKELNKQLDAINQISKTIKIVESNKELLSINNELHIVNDNLNSNKIKLEKENSDLIENNTSLSSEIKTLNENIETITEERDGLQLDNGELKKTITTLENENSGLTNKVQEQYEKIEELSAELKEVEIEKTTLEEDLTEKETELSSVKKQLSESNDKNNLLMSKVSELENELDKSNKQIVYLKGQNERIKTDYTEKTKRLTEQYNQENIEKNDALIKLREALSKVKLAEIDNNTLNQEIKLKDKEIDNLRQDISFAENLKDKLTKDKEQLNIENKKLNNNTESLKSDLLLISKIFFERAPELMSEQEFKEILNSTESFKDDSDGSNKIANRFVKTQQENNNNGPKIK
ncbi:hypothetical protein JK211_14490 [Tatumella sp. JGM130]|uniref:hypothetical protein n=1 Tax=Tatumella sp. JGM130 TaxID=2799797 RepID=UPI001BB0142A|nr:hypothetical protein [Tatumella sp. JGM130]MBS0895223.1 hypothetical protein [Tatumella sp. JGM130]